ncbi:hypothetical protein QFX18_11565 [Saccharophagus degradans]|uniref:hypothetical protein n=1 Tax=Saccharophagus degradans TaxID=86304 RepID=UPI002478174F|nr:hypothetical protein [Saccharophagus degradans]WGO96684.1 hypothetical protein QFX18_11565 [Saccharophagus degradans]
MHQDNQIYIAKLFDENEHFDDVLCDLINDLSGVSKVKQLMASFQPNEVFFVVNIPSDDIYSGLGSGISKEALSLLSGFNCNLAINYF